jgi:hypothetical protein
VTIYRANDERYQRLEYRRAGGSRLGLPALSLGLWQKFASYVQPVQEMLDIAAAVLPDDG